MEFTGKDKGEHHMALPLIKRFQPLKAYRMSGKCQSVAWAFVDTSTALSAIVFVDDGIVFDSNRFRRAHVDTESAGGAVFDCNLNGHFDPHSFD